VAAPSTARNGERVSFETLLIAAIASATAAIVVSHFWQNGTPIAAAVTPVVVALVSQALRKPMQSELVRRPVRRAASLSSAPIRRYRTGEQPVLTEQPPPEANGAGGQEPSYRVYGPPDREPEDGDRPGWRERLSRKRVRIALVTGVLAFVAAMLVITLPELIFGGSVGGTDRNTTFFGGGSDEGRDRDDGRGGEARESERDGDPGSSSPDRPADSGEESEPRDEPPSREQPPDEGQPPSEPSLPQPPPEAPPTP
jgi:hypothetical protein